MVLSKITDFGKMILHYSDNPSMWLKQNDTGLEFIRALDIYPTPHTYSEVPAKKLPARIPTEEDRLRAENAQMREALNTLGVQTE